MIIDEARSQLVQAIKSWSFTEIFNDNPAYSGVKAVVVLAGWPYATIDNELREPTSGFMTYPVVSVVATGATEVPRSLGEFFGTSPTQGLTRYGRRVEPKFLLSCWADENMGASLVVERLAGEVEGCIFYNTNRLSSYRNLGCNVGREAYEDRPGLWRMDLTVSGRAVMSYDA